MTSPLITIAPDATDFALDWIEGGVALTVARGDEATTLAIAILAALLSAKIAQQEAAAHADA